MAIRLGDGTINRIFLGSNEIKRIFLGSVIVYDKTGSTPPPDPDPDPTDPTWPPYEGPEVWYLHYDTQSLTSLFEDAYATTPASMNSPIGRAKNVRRI